MVVIVADEMARAGFEFWIYGRKVKLKNFLELSCNCVGLRCIPWVRMKISWDLFEDLFYDLRRSCKVLETVFQKICLDLFRSYSSYNKLLSIKTNYLKCKPNVKETVGWLKHEMCGFAGERVTVWDTATYAKPVSRHTAWRSGETDPLLRSTTQRIFLWSEPAFLWRDPLLLSKWWSSSPTSQRAPRCLFRRNQILRTGRVGHQQIQVQCALHHRLLTSTVIVNKVEGDTFFRWVEFIFLFHESECVWLIQLKTWRSDDGCKEIRKQVFVEMCESIILLDNLDFDYSCQ